MIVTHQNLDLDAILGVWLLKRYGGLEDAEVKFVNTGNPDSDLIAKAKAVVDTGKEFDPTRLRFDHHHLPGNESTTTCAAYQVWEWLWLQGKDIGHLEPLALLVYAGDNALKTYGADISQEAGLHALLLGYKEDYKNKKGIFAPDTQVLEWIFGLLDLLDIRLRSKVAARADLAEKIVYRSKDGRIVALKHANAAASFAAYEEGAVLVVFEGEPIVDGDGNVVSYPVGISRNPEAVRPHVGKIVEAVDWDPDFSEELKSWYKHNGGFFAGRGTEKAQDSRPIGIDIKALARHIDQMEVLD